MKIVALDISTTCTGVFVADCNSDFFPVQGRTEAIIPATPTPDIYGFLKTKKKFNGYSAFVVNREEQVSKSVKKSRDRLYKTCCENFRKQEIINGIKHVLQEEKPDIIVYEKNMSFRSMEVTRMLAELAGGVNALALMLNIPIYSVNVHTARADLVTNLNEEMRIFASTRDPEKLRRMDITKEIFKEKVLDIYKHLNLNKDMTLDESDAIVIFHSFTLQQRSELNGN